MNHCIRLLALLPALAAGPTLAFNPQPDPPARLLWQNIDIPGAVDTLAYGINNAGQISGYSDDGASTAYGFVRLAGGVTPYSMPGSGASHTENRGINNLGQVVGNYYDQSGSRYGFVHDGTNYQQLNPGGLDIVADGINDKGQIVGTRTDTAGVVHGWLFSDGAFSPLDHAGATRTLLRGINNSGQIVGEWDEPTGEQHGFLYQNGAFDDVVIPPSVSNALMGINDQGWMVGTWWDTTDTHGLLVHGDHYATLDIPGAAWTVLNGINDGGVMVGWYGLPGEGNVFHSFVATLEPVPEPASIALWAAGGLALLGWRRRRGLPLLLCALFAGGAAHAAGDHWVQAFVDARGNGQTQQQDTGTIDGPVASAGPLGFQVVDAFGSYDSSISGNAAYGHLWGQASAAQNSPLFPRQSDANADSVAFQDRLTLTSATLAPGTFVPLTVTMVLTDKLSATDPTCCANVAVNGRYGFSGMNAGDQAGPGRLSIDHQLTKVYDLLWAVGAPNDVGAILFYDVGSSPDVNSGIGGSRVDLADVTFTLTLPGGVGLVAASGHDYTAPVPEPASALLLLLGIAALPALRRRALHSRA